MTLTDFASALAYVQPGRKAYRADSLRKAAKLLNVSVHIDYAGHYGWTVLVCGNSEACEGLADVAALILSRAIIAAPVAESVAEPSLADLFAAQFAAIKAEGDVVHASALSTIAAMRSTIDAILTEPEAQPVAAVPVASPKLPRVNRLKRFAVSFSVPGPTGGDLPGWVAVEATDFDSAGAWFHDHRAALGLPSTTQIDIIRTA
jgi:hypothetical protein